MKSRFLVVVFFLFPVLLMAQWQSTFGPDPVITITCYAFKNNMIFAGTYSNSGRIYRSQNKGNQWEEADGGLPFSSAFNVSSIIVDGENLFAGTNFGIWKSSDNGDHWEQANNGLADTDIVLMGIADNYLYAFSAYSVYRSSDHGLTWDSNALINGYSGGCRSFVQKGSYIFFADIYSGIFRSQNFGTSWVNVLDISSTSAMAILGNQIFANASDNFLIRSDDNGLNWDILIDTLDISGMVVKDTSIFIGGYRGYYRSDDAGNSWISISNGIPFNRLTAMGTDNSSVYACPDILTVTNYRTDDNGNKWVRANNGLPFDRVSALATQWTSIFAGTNGGGVFGSGPTGNTWIPNNKKLSSFQINSLIIDNDEIYAGTKEGVFITYTYSDHWVPVNSGLINKDVNVILKNSGNLILGTEGGGLYLSLDDGLTWTPKNNALTNLKVRCICMAGDTVFCGTNGGGVFWSADLESNWTAVNNGLTNQNVNSLVYRDNTLFAGTDNGIFISLNKGTSWSPCNSGLMNTFINCFALTVNQILFAGTDRGIYRYSDKNQGWIKVNEMMPDTIVSSLASNHTDLYAGIVSNGVWTRPLSDFNLLEIDPGSLILESTSNSSDTISVFTTGDWILQGTLPDWLAVDKWQGSGNDNLVFKTIKENPDSGTRSAGFYVTSFTGSSVAFTIIQKAKPEGINQPDQAAVKIYPVPSTGIIYWEFNLPIIMMEICDPDGRIVRRQFPDQKSGTLDLSSERKGIYFIRIVTNRGVITKKILVI